jgi:CRP/FNR family transcriptional regulator
MPENTLFESLPAADRTVLMKGAIFKTARTNSYLFREGDKVDSVYLILEGSIKLTRYDSMGHERIVGIFSDNEFLWESMLLDNSTFPYNGVCQTKVRYYKIMREDFERALKKKDIAKGIIMLLSRKLHDANARNMYLAAEDPSSRIAGFLLYSEERSTGEYLELKLDDIAASVNLRSETVSRKLREMENDGIIERVGKGKLTILDYKRLRGLYGV